MRKVAKTNILVRNILASFQGETNFSGNVLRIRDIFWGLREEASKLGQNLLYNSVQIPRKAM